MKRSSATGSNGRAGHSIRNWTLDSGAEGVVRSQEFEGEIDLGRSRKVGLAGDVTTTAVELPSEEVVMDGDPLLPMGRAVRVGGYSFAWTSLSGPIMIKLSAEHESAMAEMLDPYPEAIRCGVQNDVPMVTESQASDARQSMIGTDGKPKVGQGVKCCAMEVTRSDEPWWQLSMGNQWGIRQRFEDVFEGSDTPKQASWGKIDI